MAESFDYYSHLQNPPKTKDEPPSDVNRMDIKGELVKVLIGWPRQRPLTNQKNLQVVLSVDPKSEDAVFTVEKFEFRASNVPKIDLVEIHADPIDRYNRPYVESPAATRRDVQRQLSVRLGGPSIEYKIKNSTQPYKDLVMDLELRVAAKNGKEEIIKKTIPLYRGQYTISTFKLLAMRWYE